MLKTYIGIHDNFMYELSATINLDDKALLEDIMVSLETWQDLDKLLEDPYDMWVSYLFDALVHVMIEHDIEINDADSGEQLHYLIERLLNREGFIHMREHFFNADSAGIVLEIDTCFDAIYEMSINSHTHS